MSDAEFIHRLLVRGESGESSYDLPLGISVVGRQPGCELVLDDNLVSRRHAQFDRSERECTLIDLESSNGTRVNDERITPGLPVVLKPGDVVRFGSHHLEYTQVPVPIEQKAPETPQAEQEIPPPLDEVQEAPAKAKRRKAPPADEPPQPPAYHLGMEAADGDLTPPGLGIHSRRLIQYLPDIYHTDFTSRFLGIFEAISLPIEWMVANFDLYLSPGSAPGAFLEWLAGWYGITFGSSWDETRRRQLLSEAHWVYANLGTRRALQRVLEIYTGVQAEIDDSSDDLEAHTFRVKLPIRERETNRPAVEQLIESTKPAHTGYLLEFKR